MLRDTKSFKERFLRWKNGESVYEAGRPIPKYEDGKDGTILNHDYLNDVFTGARLFDGLDIVVTGHRRPKPYKWVSPKGAGNMTVMPCDDEMVFFTPLAAGAAIAASPAYAGLIGNVATPGSAFWTSPITKQLMVGTAASEAINKATKAVTGYNSVGEGVGASVEAATGWNPNNYLLGQLVTEAFNPGWYWSPNGVMGAVGRTGNAVRETVNSAANKLPWTYGIPENPNMAYRRMGPLERDWLMEGNELSTRSTNTLTETEREAAVAAEKAANPNRRFVLFKAGAEHGGRKLFAKGQPWGGTTVTHGEEQVLAIPGKGLPWVSGRHYHGPQGNGFRVGDVLFEEAPFGSHIDLLTEEGYTGVNPSLLNGSVIYSPFKIFGHNFGYKKLYPTNTSAPKGLFGITRRVNKENLLQDATSQRPLATLDFSDPSGRNLIEKMAYSPILTKSKELLMLEQSSPFAGLDVATDPYVDLYNKAVRSAAEPYLDQIVDKPTPQEVIDIFNNSVLPRLLFMRPGYRGGLMYPTVKSRVDHTLSRGYTVYPKELFEKARGNDTTVGLHYPETGHIGIKEGYEDFAGGHEFRHRLDKALIKTDTEADILEAAYDDDFLKLSDLYDDLKDVKMGPEAVTTNFDARNAAIGKHHASHTDWTLLNKIIDKLSDEKIIEAVEKSNGYGQAYIDYLRKNNKLTPTKIHQFREAMKWVGMFAGATPILNLPKQK